MDPNAIEKLRAAKDALNVQTIIGNRDAVLTRFRPIFQSGAMGALKEDDFRQFLSVDHNKHWTGLLRQPATFADMKELRKTLCVLVDENRPIQDRVNTATKAPGMGVAKVSAILLVAYPAKYGVWNGTSEKGLRLLGLWPSAHRGATDGDKYITVNQVLLKLAKILKIDLWTLDALWWGLDLSGASSTAITGNSKGHPVDNWKKAIDEMKSTILKTVINSNGQMVETKVKNKELKMSESELETLLQYLLKKQKRLCAITKLPFDVHGDKNMRPSADRIDSNGHYEASNLQLVCRFINFWKQASDNVEFRHLIQVVRDSKSTNS